MMYVDEVNNGIHDIMDIDWMCIFGGDIVNERKKAFLP
jgi:hypothetical protein